MKDLTPPAIVKSVDELSQWAQDINAAHLMGESSMKQGAKHMRRAGRMLIKAKSRVGHGNWLAWLKKNVKCTSRTVSSYMAMARKSGKSETVSDLNDELKPLTDPAIEDQEEPPEREPGIEDEEEPEEEGPAKPESKKTIFCPRCNRVGPVKDCENCAALRGKSRGTGTTISGSGSSKQKSGTVAVDWKKFDDRFTTVAQFPNKIANAYPEEKKSTEYINAMGHLDAYAETMKAWRDRLAKVKK